MAQMIEYFDFFTKQGMKVIPLWENSKVPMFKGWTKDWDFLYCRQKLMQYPEANIGILLGDIIDVEGDTEEANKFLLDLIEDYPHPCYSSRKSIHHLFRTPEVGFRLLKYNNIEFRGDGHQSVLPPSQTEGSKYGWCYRPSFPVPEMPERLLKYFWRLRKGKKDILKPGHVRVWCSKCQEKCFLHKKRFLLELEGFGSFGLRWECWGCRQHDMRPICRKIRKSRQGLQANPACSSETS